MTGGRLILPFPTSTSHRFKSGFFRRLQIIFRHLISSGWSGVIKARISALSHKFLTFPQMHSIPLQQKLDMYFLIWAHLLFIRKEFDKLASGCAIDHARIEQEANEGSCIVLKGCSWKRYTDIRENPQITPHFYGLGGGSWLGLDLIFFQCS